MINHPRRSKVAASIGAEHDHETDYAALLASVTQSFDAVDGPLFTTNAAGLYEIYLGLLPGEQNVHTCTACRRFVEGFGGLVTIDENGRARSAMWSCLPPAFYAPAVTAMRKEVERSRITGPFYSAEKRYGMPKTGAWTHFSATPERASVFVERALTAGQAMASKREDFRTVASALADFTPDLLTQALRLLEGEKLVRSERFIGPVRWLMKLHEDRAAAKDSRVRDNILWSAIATAPEGYCHPRASVVGSLLEDISAGLPFADVKARFDAKLHPLQYQRPQAAPAAGAIAAAEKLVEKLGIAPSLERRWARLDEIEAIWRPKPVAAKSGTGGVFGHLKAKDDTPASALSIPPTTMTWEKFCRMALPGATSIQVMVPGHGNFIAMTTAVNADAPLILKWDNPVAWYVYHGGSSAAQWGLRAGWCKVEAISLSPSSWGTDAPTYLHEGVILVLEGAQDSRNESACLFPETLKADLHGARSVIEAYSKAAKLGDAGGPAASGLHLGKSAAGYTLRVTSAIGVADYRIDRWD
jgi:hypothetical protein